MSYTRNLSLLQLCLILQYENRRQIEHDNSLADHRVWLVGGAVRDHLIGVEPKDFDIAMSLSPDHTQKALMRNDWRIMEAGIRFQVMHVSKDDNLYEVAQFRNDGPYKDGRPEQVTPGTMTQDAERRDFTVNALFMDPFSGQIEDPTGRGLDDIRTRTLRFVGRPIDRITEDPMRVFRFFRMIQKGFVPVPGHLRDVRTHFNTAYNRLAEHGTEGVRQELEKMTGIPL